MLLEPVSAVPLTLNAFAIFRPPFFLRVHVVLFLPVALFPGALFLFELRVRVAPFPFLSLFLYALVPSTKLEPISQLLLLTFVDPS